MATTWTNITKADDSGGAGGGFLGAGGFLVQGFLNTSASIWTELTKVESA